MSRSCARPSPAPWFAAPAASCPGIGTSCLPIGATARRKPKWGTSPSAPAPMAKGCGGAAGSRCGTGPHSWRVSVSTRPWRGRLLTFIPAGRLPATARNYGWRSLRAQNLACVGINDREFADADLAATRLVIVPHFGMGYRQSTYRKLMAYAAAGGVVWAHADSLRRDEEGKLDPARTVQFTNARIPAGRGALEWYFGWSIPTHWEPGTSTHRFEQIIRGMNWKRPAEGVMPLTNGELRFQGDKDQTSIRTVQVVDAGGTVTRAWSGDGSPLAWPQISFHSSGQLFVLKVDSSTFRVKWRSGARQVFRCRHGAPCGISAHRFGPAPGPGRNRH